MVSSASAKVSYLSEGQVEVKTGVRTGGREDMELSAHLRMAMEEEA